jgi:hypothetical protein
MLRLSGTKLLTILTRLAELVGFVGPKNHVLDLISNSASSQVVKVIWIVGAGGLARLHLQRRYMKVHKSAASSHVVLGDGVLSSRSPSGGYSAQVKGRSITENPRLLTLEQQDLH